VTLIHQVALFSGLSCDGYVLVNASRDFSELGFGDFFDSFRPERLMTCPATDIALEHIGRPLPNAALLGAFAALSGEITLAAIDKAVREHFAGAVGERNATAVAAAFNYVASATKGAQRASTD
jgi:pyruvate ferredoxin oxidoreductase gamma subunit